MVLFLAICIGTSALARHGSQNLKGAAADITAGASRVRKDCHREFNRCKAPHDSYSETMEGCGERFGMPFRWELLSSGAWRFKLLISLTLHHQRRHRISSAAAGLERDLLVQAD